MKLTIAHMGMGLIDAQNDTLVLAGGFRSGNSGAGETRRKYVAYDKAQWIALAKAGVAESEIAKRCELGFVELFVKDGEEVSFGVTGLVNIEIEKAFRRQGWGRQIIEAIRHTTGQPLVIHDIKKHVASTWRKLGVTQFHTRHGKPIQISKHPAAAFLAGTIPAV